MSPRFGPPAWMERWLRRRLPADFEEVVAGDLAEEWEERAARSRVGAALWYLGQVLTIDTAALRDAAASLNGEWARQHGRSTRERLTTRGVVGIMGQDFRYALRRLVRSPGFTLVAVLSLGLGIGANSALFTAVNAVFLQDDGIREPERVVQIYWDGQNPTWSITWAWYRDMRDDLADVFGEVTAYRLQARRTDATGDRLVSTILVSGDYFGVMGNDFLLGRGFEPGVETDVEGGPPVAVLTHWFWTNALGADPDIIGKNIRVDAEAFTVVGVLPEGFSGKASGVEVELFLPDWEAPAYPNADNLVGGARLADGVTLPQAEAGLVRLAAALQAGRSEDRTPIRFSMFPESEVRVHPGLDQAAVPMVALLGAVVLMVLVIACTNLASFLLARAADRRKEFAIRRAIGAARGRVISQLMIESFLLAAVGALVGIFIAQLSLRAVLAIELPIPIALNLDTGVDGRVLVFTAGVAVLATFLFGIFPALAAGREEVAPTLRDESTGAGGGRGKVGLRGALVVAQIALSLTLLVGAGLFIRSLASATSVDPGFERSGIAAITVDPGNTGYDLEESRRILDRALGEIRAMPGVEQAALGVRVPLELGIWRSGIRRMDVPPPPGREYWMPQNAYVGDGYFETLGFDLIAGRGFESTDDENAPPVAVINEALAEDLWPGERDVVGRTVELANHEGEPATVVGLVRDFKVASLTEGPTSYLFQPMKQSGTTSAIVLAKVSGGDPRVLAERMREQVKTIDPDMYVHSATTVHQMTDAVFFLPRMAAILLAIFGGLALLLASVGLYGLVSFGVKRREKEVGIRLSLGADPAGVVRMIMKSGTRLAVLGVAIGVVMGVIGGSLVERFLFGVPGIDLVTLTLVPLFLAGVAALASWIPARRAASVDPVQSLRNE